MTPEKLLRKQAEMKRRLSSPHGNDLATQAAKGRAVAKARLAIREALKKARRLKQKRRAWRKSNSKLRSDKRNWHAALRKDAKALHIEAKNLHKEMEACKAVLRSTRAAHNGLTVGEITSKALSTGYALGVEAEKQRKAQNES